FTIQGFDLNYAGVIIGPSVKFRNGKIIYDKSESKNIQVTQNRKLSDDTMKNFGEELLRNELHVLLTRGVNGLYIYAVDD
ncbi:DNA/RNA helicase domain-containing protein, partial [Staphylococcus hominis]